MKVIKASIGFIGCTFLGFFLMVACGSNQEKIAPEITTIRQSVYASATVRPDSLYQVYTIVCGMLHANKVCAGDAVQSTIY